MPNRLLISVLAAGLAAGGAAPPAAAQDHTEFRHAIRHSVREAVRDARRSVRDAIRDAAREVRAALRDSRGVRHDVRDAMRDVNRSMRQLDRELGRIRVEDLDVRLDHDIRVRINDVVDTRVRLSGAAGAALRQSMDADPCADRWGDDDDRQVCEVRESTLPAGPLTVDAGQNGGIRVEGADRSDIRVQAIVRTNARTDDRAKELAGAVEVLSGSGHVSARGPSTGRRESWSVSYRIQVPRSTNLELDAHNGGITISGVSGDIHFDTSNGGVKLADLGGDVRGRTRNGGLHVELAGRQWDGSGLDVETTNGGVVLDIPDGYNARLETRTVNGGFRTDFPITVQGELNFRRGVSTTLGSGGAPVRVRTTNGGLRINRR
ncbi:MAG: DUF4097 domain-containing protein [Vicinamibacterales bacterium]